MDMDQSSAGVGFLAVFAVSGSVAFIVRLVHKRLVADFMKKIEQEFSGSGGKMCQVKKKVRFAEHVIGNSEKFESKVVEEGSDDKLRKAEDDQTNVKMPLNRLVLYKQILQYRTFKKP